MYNKKEFQNGLRLITVPMKQIESVTLQVFARVGGRDEEEKLAGLSHFLEHMVFKGTKKRRSMKAVSEEVEKVGGAFNAATSNEFTVFYVKVPKEKIEVAFDVLSDSLFNSLFKEMALEKERKVIIEEINVYEDMPMVKVGSVFSELLFPDHSLGFELTGTKKSVSGIQRDDLVSYLEKHYGANNLVLSLAGNFDPKLVNRLTQKYFLSVKKKKTPPILKFEDKQKENQVKILSKKTDQTHLCLGLKTFPITHSDRFKLELLNAILGKGASSRLFESLRDKEGLCYYISSETDFYLDTGVWVARAGVDHKRVDKAIKLIVKEFSKLKNCRVTKKELSRAKEYLKGSLKLSLELSNAQANFYGLQEILLGKILSPGQICEEIDKITTDDLLELAQDLLNKNFLNLAIVGPFEKKERFLELLNL